MKRREKELLKEDIKNLKIALDRSNNTIAQLVNKYHDIRNQQEETLKDIKSLYSRCKFMHNNIMELKNVEVTKVSKVVEEEDDEEIAYFIDKDRTHYKTITRKGAQNGTKAKYKPIY